MRCRSSELAEGRHNYWRYIKPLIGIALLAILLLWVGQQGTLQQRLKGMHLLFPSLITCGSIILGAMILRCIVASYNKRLAQSSALYISAIGTLGNALGGFSLGTTIKYVTLYKQGGLTIKQITAGLVFFTLTILTFLVVIAATSIWVTPIPQFYKILSLVLLFASPATALVIWHWLRHTSFWLRLIQPLIAKERIWQVLLLSFFSSALFIVNFCVIGISLFPELPLSSLIFISSLGILAGQGIMIQSIGGVQEFLMGLSTLLLGFSVLDGVQIALVSRIASIIASGIIVLISYAVYPGNRKLRHMKSNDNA